MAVMGAARCNTGKLWPVRCRCPRWRRLHGQQRLDALGYDISNTEKVLDDVFLVVVVGQDVTMQLEFCSVIDVQLQVVLHVELLQDVIGVQFEVR